jgi:2-polyprenyl-6-methoxyphenol hydroxylase-like FAD-dependent oxidoreductase
MEPRTRVLVVGAGPVGLLTALVLRRAGIEVSVVDEHEHTSIRSFAIVLHPRTVALLAELGVVEPLVWRGRSFRHVAVFADHERRALLEVPSAGEFAEGGLTLPQDVLRKALEAALAGAGVEVTYRQRLVALEPTESAVRARLVRRVRGTTGGATEWHDAEETCVTADFVVGADGHDSTVRRLLNIPLVEFGAPRTFAFFDVPHPPPAGAAVELAFDALVSAAYPLHGGHTRYTFELERAPQGPLGARELEALRREHMPWQAPAPASIEWSATRAFRSAMAASFGRGRSWLLGDAAHATCPLGAQSLNIGLREARELALSLVACLAGQPLQHLEREYAVQRRLEWRRLLGLDGAPMLGARTPHWAAHHFRQLLAALPSSGDELDDLLGQLGITLL